jgi:hypothetical protein
MQAAYLLGKTAAGRQTDMDESIFKVTSPRVGNPEEQSR